MLPLPQRVLFQEDQQTPQTAIPNHIDLEQTQEQKAQILMKKLFNRGQHIQSYYDRDQQEEYGMELGFSSVGNQYHESQEQPQRELMKYLQPGFIFEVIVIEKLMETRELVVVLQRFLSFCDRCSSSAFKHHDADFGLFSKHRQSLEVLIKVNTMNIKGIIDDSEVIEDFSCFAYYMSFNKIQVGDHLNAVVLQVDQEARINKPILQMSLKNKCLLGGKMWSLVNLQDPRTFNLATPASFRLGFTRMIGKSFEQSCKTEEQKSKQNQEIRKIIDFKEQFGVLSLHYQIQNDVFFMNKQNYDLMIKSLRLSQFHSLISNNNLDNVQSINLDYRRHSQSSQLEQYQYYHIPLYYKGHNSISLRIEDYTYNIIYSYYQAITCLIIIMSKQQQFLTHIESFNHKVDEKQLQLVVSNDLITQVFENSFILHSKSFSVNKTEYDLMGSVHTNLPHIYLFTLQGIIEWDVVKNQQSNFIKTEEIYCGDFMNEMICTAHDKTVMVWEQRTKAPVNLILAHSMQITSCIFDENAKYIVTTGQDNYCRVLHSYYPECLRTIYLSKVDHTLHAMFTRDSRHLLVSTANKALSLWNWAQSEVLACYSAPGLKNTRFLLNPGIIYEGGRPSRILQAGDDGLVGMFDFMKPQTQGLIQRVQEQNPVRFALNEGKMFTFNPNSSEVNIYKIKI